MPNNKLAAPVIVPPSGSGGADYDPDGMIADILGPGPGAIPATPAAPVVNEPAAPVTPATPAAPVVREPAAPQPRVLIDDQGSAVPTDVLPKPAAPAPAVVDDSEDPMPEEVERGGAKAKNAWTKTKAEKRELRNKVKELETQLAARGEPQKPPEMQKLLDMQTQIAQYEQQLGELDLTRTKGFKARFDIPLERVDARIGAMLQRSGLQPADVKALSERLVATSVDEAQGLVSDLPVAVQGAVYTALMEREQLVSDRGEALKNWRDTRAAIEQTAAVDEDIQLARNIDKDTSAAVQKAVEAGNWMYNSTGGKVKEWDEAVQARTQAVRGILRSAPQEDLVRWVVEGVTAPPLRALYLKEKARADGLAAELAQRQNLRPGVRGGAPAAVSTPAPEPGTGLDPKEFVDQLLQ